MLDSVIKFSAIVILFFLFLHFPNFTHDALSVFFFSRCICLTDFVSGLQCMSQDGIIKGLRSDQICLTVFSYHWNRSAWFQGPLGTHDTHEISGVISFESRKVESTWYKSLVLLEKPEHSQQRLFTLYQIWRWLQSCEEFSKA